MRLLAAAFLLAGCATTHYGRVRERDSSRPVTSAHVAVGHAAPVATDDNGYFMFTCGFRCHTEAEVFFDVYAPGHCPHAHYYQIGPGVTNVVLDPQSSP